MGLGFAIDMELEMVFQSTHPVWDGTKQSAAREFLAWISIHPSRVGWDCTSAI